MYSVIFIIGGIVAILAVAAAALWMVGRRDKRTGSAKSSQLATSLKGERLKSDIIINAIDDGVVLIDDQQVIQLLNPAAAAILGWDVKEAVGLDWRSVFKFVDDKGQPKENDVPIQDVLVKGETVRRNDSHLLTKANKTISAAFTVSALVGDNKTASGAVGVFRDVSEERKEEAQRADFISTASHEMRTPVAAIEGYLALALNDKVSTIDSRARDYLDKAHTSTQHLGKLFQDLLTSARAEDGRLSNHPVVVEIGALLDQLTSDLKFTAEKKGLAMEFALTSSHTIDASAESDSSKVIRPLYYTKADPERLREVITNLFDNAVKYTEAGKVTMGLTGDKNVVQFSVRDTGGGIPAEDIPHLFQKFYRVDSSATRTIGGTGLGLFICKKIIELYGGRIWVTSEVDKGSAFYINLPRLDSEQAEQLKLAETSNTVLAPITSLSNA